jgi:hypothetical protein
MLGALVQGALASDPMRDLVGKTYRVETDANGAVNVQIDANRVGYGVVSPGRVVPGGGDMPAYRIETLGDDRGTSVVLTARFSAHLSPGIDEWLVTAATPAPAVSSDSNLSYACQGNSATGQGLTFVYYDNERRGRPVRKVKAAFVLDRLTGQLQGVVGKSQPNCQATEDPL